MQEEVQEEVQEGVQEEVREGLQEHEWGGTAGQEGEQEGAHGDADDSWDVESEHTGQRQDIPSRIAKVEVANSAYLSKDG